MQKINHLGHLKWACRRGMLELDLVLGTFLAEKYPTLTLEDQAAFEELLNISDHELASWLILGRDQVPYHFQAIVAKVRGQS